MISGAHQTKPRKFFYYSSAALQVAAEYFSNSVPYRGVLIRARSTCHHFRWKIRYIYIYIHIPCTLYHNIIVVFDLFFCFGVFWSQSSFRHCHRATRVWERKSLVIIVSFRFVVVAGPLGLCRFRTNNMLWMINIIFFFLIRFIPSTFWCAPAAKSCLRSMIVHFFIYLFFADWQWSSFQRSM